MRVRDCTLPRAARTDRQGHLNGGPIPLNHEVKTLYLLETLGENSHPKLHFCTARSRKNRSLPPFLAYFLAANRLLVHTKDSASVRSKAVIWQNITCSLAVSRYSKTYVHGVIVALGRDCRRRQPPARLGISNGLRLLSPHPSDWAGAGRVCHRLAFPN